MGWGWDIDFWGSEWEGSNALKNSFARLFNLSTEREVSVRDMRKWVHGLWVWRWRCRRELFEREREKHVLNNLVDAINRYSIQEHTKDDWKWTTNTEGCFTTKKAYCLLIDGIAGVQVNTETLRAFKKIWKTNTPIKASITT